MALVRQFHHGMQARVLMDKELSERFEATSGRRQGCVLCTLLFNFPFAATLEKVIVRLREDNTILKDMVHLDEETRR